MFAEFVARGKHAEVVIKMSRPQHVFCIDDLIRIIMHAVKFISLLKMFELKFDTTI